MDLPCWLVRVFLLPSLLSRGHSVTAVKVTFTSAPEILWERKLPHVDGNISKCWGSGRTSEHAGVGWDASTIRKWLKFSTRHKARCLFLPLKGRRRDGRERRGKVTVEGWPPDKVKGPGKTSGGTRLQGCFRTGWLCVRGRGMSLALQPRSPSPQRSLFHTKASTANRYTHVSYKNSMGFHDWMKITESAYLEAISNRKL